MEISINVHYLPDQIRNFLNEKKFNVQIYISDETELLLDTGGGVFAGTNNFNDNPSFAGDFNLKDRLVFKDSENKLIFTGLHITKRS